MVTYQSMNVNEPKQKMEELNNFTGNSPIDESERTKIENRGTK